MFIIVCDRRSRPLWPNSVSLSFLSGSDGLVKLWTIKTNECVKTFDAHQDKVWALHSSSTDDLMVTGSADSTITLWKVSPLDSFSSTMWQNTVMKLCELFHVPREKVHCFTLWHWSWWMMNMFQFLISGLLCTAVQYNHDDKADISSVYIYLL